MSCAELHLYTAEDESTAVQSHAEDMILRLTQRGIATRFDTTKQNDSLHIKSILAERELVAASTVKESLTVRTEGGLEQKLDASSGSTNAPCSPTPASSVPTSARRWPLNGTRPSTPGVARRRVGRGC